MPPVHIMIKPVSGLCNMRCSYCFYADEIEHRSDKMCKKMTETTLENVVKKVWNLRTVPVHLLFREENPPWLDWTFIKNF